MLSQAYLSQSRPNNDAFLGKSMMALQALFVGEIDKFNQREKKHSSSEIKEHKKDLLGYSDGIELYQQPQLNEEYFDSYCSRHDIKKISELTSSIALSKLGGLVEIERWFGVYTPSRLTDYLNLVNESIKEIQHSVAFVLSSTHYAICLYYHATEKKWFFIDANHLPVSEISFDKLRDAVWYSLAENGEILAFETQVVSAGKQIEMIKKFIASFTQSNQFKEIHTIQPKDVAIANENYLPIANIPAEFNHENDLRTLIEYKVDLELTDKKGNSAIILATYEGHANIAALLLNKVDLTKKRLDGWQAFHIAAYFGHEDTLKVLSQKNELINSCNERGNTAAHIASERGFPNLIKILGEMGADLKISNKNKRSPATLAALNGRLSVLDALHEQGIWLWHPDPGGEIPYTITNNSLVRNHLFTYRFHTLVLNTCKELGYDDKLSDGKCFGIGLMESSACLTDDLKALEKRHRFIIDLSRNGLFSKKFQEYKNTFREQKSTSSEIKKTNGLTLNPENQLLIDAFGFLDGVSIYQNPDNHLHCFSNSYALSQSEINKTSQIVQSHKLEELGGLQTIYQWPGIYTETNLKAYGELLIKTLQSQKNDILFVISNSNHAICLCYKNSFKQFYLIDASQSPPRLIPSQDLAKEIQYCFFWDGKIMAFETLVVSVGNDKTSVTQCINHLINTSEFKKLHDVNVENALKTTDSKVTLAYIAASHHHIEVIKSIIRNKGDINTVTAEEKNPLYTAACSGNAEIIDLLACAGANTLHHTKNHSTPAIIAACRGHLNVLKILEKHDVDLSEPLKHAQFPTLLHCAASFNRLEVLHYLLKRKININEGNANGQTPVYLACMEGHSEALKLFCQRRANLMKHNKGGYTPAAVAAHSGHLEVLKILLENGVDLTQKCPAGKTPLEIAKSQNQERVVMFLEKLESFPKLSRRI